LLRSTWSRLCTTLGKTALVENREQPTHRRTIVIESYETDDAFAIEAVLKDERPWADGKSNVHDVHEMHLDVTVNKATLTITDAKATMAHFPHEECRSIEPAFRALVGLSVMRGYTRNVQERLGRERGCSHLEFLARAIGPAVIQSMASAGSRRGTTVVSGPEVLEQGSWLRNTCHLWAEGGIGSAKIAEGWRPGMDGYPTASLVALRRRDKAHEDLA